MDGKTSEEKEENWCKTFDVLTNLKIEKFQNVSHAGKLTYSLLPLQR